MNPRRAGGALAGPRASMATVPTRVPITQTPPLPPGGLLELPGRGPLFVRDSGGAADRPVLVLFHGWLATADLNWGFSYPTLTEHFRVVAYDQRGHGRGVKSRRRFTFDACAADAVAVLDALGIESAIAVGYSMGGPIALTLARRHPDRVAGLVLCATAGAFTSSPLIRTGLAPMGPLVSATRLVPDLRIRRMLRRRFISRRAEGRWQEWITAELEPSDLTTMLEAGAALTRCNAIPWAGRLGLPTAVVETTRDELVPPRAQEALVRALRTARTFPLDAGHLVCFDDPEHFAPVLLDACLAVARPR